MHVSRGSKLVFVARFSRPYDCIYYSPYNMIFEVALAQFSREEYCCYFWHVFQEGRAQKSRQPTGIFSLVEISCILIEHDCHDIFLEEIIKTL